MESTIDVVYTWVDDANPKFRRDMLACLQNVPEPPHRTSFRPGIFRNNGELLYSLRSLDKFAPWVRKIYIVTDADSPSWLIPSDNRVSVIPHDVIFTRKSELPTFNSNAIESHLHRIPNLSRWFLAINDDFLGRPVSLEDFVTPLGGQYVYLDHELPAKIPEEWIDDRSQAYTRTLIQRLCDRPVSRLVPAHVPRLFDREILFHFEELFPGELRDTSSHRFRSPTDVSTPTLYSFYVSEVLGREDGHERRFLTPLALSGL